MEEKDYAKAIALFTSLGDFKDSKAYLQQLKTNSVDNTKIMDYIDWGKYGIDLETSSVSEAISWRVLDKDNQSLLLVADSILDIKPFHQSADGADWEDSTIRTWLNRDFLFVAFSDSEREAIATTKIINYNNPENEPESEPLETEDKIFLLSFEEIENYFESEVDRMAEITSYAKSQLGDPNIENYYSWWLRSPGDYADETGFVFDYGDYGSDNVAHIKGVRPALWLNLPS